MIHFGNLIVRQTLAAVKSVPAVLLHLPLLLLYRLLLRRPLPQADEQADKKNEDSKQRTLVLGRWDARSINIIELPSVSPKWKAREFHAYQLSPCPHPAQFSPDHFISSCQSTQFLSKELGGSA